MTAPQTLAQLFFDAIGRFDTKRAALRYKADGKWHDITHQELARRVQHIGLGLRELGINPGDRVAILATNRPEWAIADFACLTIGCADVSVYPVSTLPMKVPRNHTTINANPSSVNFISPRLTPSELCPILPSRPRWTCRGRRAQLLSQQVRKRARCSGRGQAL